MTGVIQNNKYVAFKGVINGILSFPISGCINIESNITSPLLKCDFASDIINTARLDIEMVIVCPNIFLNAQKMTTPELLNTFRIMNSARVVVTSDEIRAVDLFLMMRKTENMHPNGLFSGLSEKVVI